MSSAIIFALCLALLVTLTMERLRCKALVARALREGRVQGYRRAVLHSPAIHKSLQLLQHNPCPARGATKGEA